jgi:hypothetical protein
MANNKNLAEVSKGTQFAKGEGYRSGGRKAWSIRNQIRFLAALDIDLNKSGALEEAFGPHPTVAQRAAFSALLKTVGKKSDIRAIEFADERIDGKLVQPTLNADLAAIQNMDENELRSFISNLDDPAGTGAGQDEAATAGDATGTEAETHERSGAEVTPDMASKK